MSKKKLLFICGNVSPNSSQGVRYLNMLPYFENEFELFTLSFNNFYGDNPQRNFVIKNKIEGSNNIENFQIQNNVIKKGLKRTYKKIIRPLIFPDKYIFFINDYKLRIKNLIVSKNISTVIIGMTPFSLFQLINYIKSLNKNVQIIIDLSDPFSFNGNNNYFFIYNKSFITKYERKKINLVDKVVVLNPTIKNIYKNAFNSNKIYVIEQGINIPDKKKEKQNSKHNSVCTLIYAGGLYHGFREAFELYKALNLVQTKVILNVFGNIKNSLLANNNANVNFKGQISSHRLVEQYSNSDILVFIDNNEGYQVPGKLFELMVMNKPILFIYSNLNSPSLNYIDDSDYVIKVKNNAEDIAKGIVRIIETDFTNAKNIDLSKFYWEILMDKYKKLIYD